MRYATTLFSLLCLLAVGSTCAAQNPFGSPPPFGSPTTKDPIYDLSNLVKAGFEMVEGKPALVVADDKNRPPKPPAPRNLAEVASPDDLPTVGPFDGDPVPGQDPQTILLVNAKIYRLDGSVVTAAEARKILTEPGPVFLTNRTTILPADKLLQQAMKDSVLVVSTQTPVDRPMARMVPQAESTDSGKQKLPKGLVPLEDFR